MDIYETLIALDTVPNGNGKRVSVEADSVAHAKELLEAEYGLGRVLSLWNEREAQKPR
jgi:hypothetical protein